VIGAGEVFGGGAAPAIAGQIAAASGIQHVFTFTIGSLVVRFIVALFLKETAPRKPEAAPA
jgi:fucose permease